MSNKRFAPEFKDKAVRQVVERGNPVGEVTERLGVSAHSLCKWVNAVWPDKSEQQANELIEAKSEILKLRAQLRRTEAERSPTAAEALRSIGLLYAIEREIRGQPSAVRSAARKALGAGPRRVARVAAGDDRDAVGEVATRAGDPVHAGALDGTYPLGRGLRRRDR